MRLQLGLLIVLIASLGLTEAIVKAGSGGSHLSPVVPGHPVSSGNVISLADFGALGDGLSDDGPALQNALDALGAVGGGTLLVPAGRYVIATPVHKDFTNLASSVTILGVESLTPVPPANSSGQVLTRGLDLVSEFAPRTEGSGVALEISGLHDFLIKHITFIGTPGITTDAVVTLALNDIGAAAINHCEFYGLSSLVGGGSIVRSVRTDLRLEQSVFLGCATNSGVSSPVVQNWDWKGVSLEAVVFVDYGQRPELYGKLGLAAPAAWVNLGSAKAPESDSPRRQAVFKNVFLDEGAINGLSSLPYLGPLPSAPIDLFYVSGLYQNVSNLGSTGNYLYGPVGVLIEDAHYGWSHNADAAINLRTVGTAILDRLECGAHADRIRADSATGSLTVIDSVYNHLDSLAHTTRVITTSAPGEDPVQYVRQQFTATLGHAPDPAAHFYWSDRILDCLDNSQCINEQKAALSAYLAGAPQEKFAVSGQILDETGAPMSAISVALSGSQSLTIATDINGRYQFSNLPTSGSYTVTPSRSHYSFSPASRAIINPANDQIFDSVGTFNHHDISGMASDDEGNPLSGVTVTLSGSQSLTMTTGADGRYLFEELPAGGNYTVTPRKTSYVFSPANLTLNDLDSDNNQTFSGTFTTYTIGGILIGLNNTPISGATVTLSGDQQRSTTSDGGGGFAFSDVPSEGNYVVTPTLSDHSFSPSSRAYDSLAGNQYHAYVANNSRYSITGRVTHSNGIPLAGALLSISGHATATTHTDANGYYGFSELPWGGNFTITVSKPNFTPTAASQTLNNLVSDETLNFAGTLQNTFGFSASSYTVSEGTRTLTITVNRTGDTSIAGEVVYSGTDGSADQRGDVIPVMGLLSFAPGETTKSFIVFITDDAFVEGTQSITLELNDELGSPMGNNATATLTITDNDTSTTSNNPIDGADFFVRQQYRDFLNRPSDPEGRAFWTNQILACGTDTACVADKRMNVSAAFFLSIEFQQTGFLVYRLYQASYAQVPQHLDEFLLDTRTIGEGVIVNAPGWQDLLEANTTQFLESFVTRVQFLEAYPPNLTPAEFVDLLNGKTGGSLSSADMAAAIAEFQGDATSESVPARARALRLIAQSATFTQRQLNPAFVLMQYFGYLQRNPSDFPNTNLDGYNFWLHKLDEFNGDFRRADMVQSFLVSGEYRARFGSQ